MNKRAWLNILGFGLFALGTLALVLNLVALEYSFLRWMDALGPLGSFVLKLVFVFGGIIMMVVANERDEAEYDEFFDGPASRPKQSRLKPSKPEPESPRD